MKITCIVASFNRPRFLREALRSIATQTHRNFQVIVVDESTAFDAYELVSEFKFDDSITIHENVTPSARAKRNRLGVNVNNALEHADGDLITYLADDDGYFPGWFEKLSAYFEAHPDVFVAFGILKYCREILDFSEAGEIRFWNEVIKDPSEKLLDHNQVAHRRLDPTLKWPENLGTESNADFWFFTRLAALHPFHPLNAWAAAKRLHGKNLQNHVSLYQSGKMDDLRE